MNARHTLLGFVALAALAAGPAPAEMKPQGGALTVAIEGDLNGFDPLESALGEAGSTVAATILEPLVYWNFETNEPEPRLATEWSESDDHLTWTFKLREGVKFHDGSDFDADDVVFHYDRMLNPENKYGGRGKMETITGVRAVDDHTVEFTLAAPWAAMLPLMADTAISGPIPPREALEAGTQNRHPIGTGPFRFAEWRSGDRIVVERFDEYWDAEDIALDKITFRILPDTQTRFASLISGEVDVVLTDRGATIVEAQKNPDLVTLNAEGSGASTILLNMRNEPLSDQRVRDAIAHAWNQAALVKISFQDTRPVIEHPLGIDCGDTGYKGFDMAKAKELVAAYGKPVTVSLMHTNTPGGRELGELMQQLLKSAGITLELKPVDLTTLIRNTFKREYELTGWRMGGDSDMGSLLYSASVSTSPYNLSGYTDPEIDELGKKMRVAPTREERLDLQCQMAKRINENVGQLYMGGGSYWAFTTPRVKGVSRPFNGIIDTSRAWIEE